MSGPLLGAALAIPTLAAPLAIVSGSRARLREATTYVAAGSLTVVLGWLSWIVVDGGTPELALFEITDGVRLLLRADALGVIFGLVASFLWLATSVYATGYLRGVRDPHQRRFSVFFALCLASVMGLALSANLVTFLVFFELLTIATYPLVTHAGTSAALRAGRRYLAYLLAGGAALVVGVAVVHAEVGARDFRAGGLLDGSLSHTTQLTVLALLAIGFGSKAAVIPLHRWLPSAMVAPTPVSALLHAVAVVTAGLFGIARTVGYVFGPDALRSLGVTALISVLAAVTIVAASAIALFQDNLKRRLAYSTIAHLSYVVLGLSLLSSAAWTGGLLHLVNHAVLKITLFFCAGTLYVHAHRDRVSELDGIGRRMPVTMGAFALAAVGLVGLPPMGGFMSKWYLVAGTAESDQVWFTAVMVIGGLLSAGYLFPVIVRAFFRVPSASADLPSGEASPWLVGPLVATAGVGLAFGLGETFSIFELVIRSTDAVMGIAR